MTIVDVIEVENADVCKLTKKAKNNGLDLNYYVIRTYAKNLFK